MYERNLKRERMIALAEQAATGLNTWSQPTVSPAPPRLKRRDVNREIRVLERTLLELEADALLYGSVVAVLEEFI